MARLQCHWDRVRGFDAMVSMWGLLGRSIAGAVAGLVIGLIADLLLRTQGYSFVGFMAGMIAGAMSVYFWNEGPEEEEAAASPPKE